MRLRLRTTSPAGGCTWKARSNPHYSSSIFFSSFENNTWPWPCHKIKKKCQSTNLSSLRLIREETTFFRFNWKKSEAAHRCPYAALKLIDKDSCKQLASCNEVLDEASRRVVSPGVSLRGLHLFRGLKNVGAVAVYFVLGLGLGYRRFIFTINKTDSASSPPEPFS